jgi:hypothetical protein
VERFASFDGAQRRWPLPRARAARVPGNHLTAVIAPERAAEIVAFLAT